MSARAHHQRRRVGLLLIGTAALLGAIAAAPVANAAPGDAAGDETAALVARGFFRALLDGRVSDLLPLCGEQLNLDGQRVAAGPELQRALDALIQRARSETLILRGLQLLSYAEMVGRYGPPPARLRASVGRRDLLAVARFNRMGAVAVLSRKGRFWQVVALTD
ncbi:MAG: hypothetical protein IPL40_12800 [Proteobacteria bacterium]|nr:hypothetical protein [Pseudomonadota bacterium]